jgi:hypothetical protein
MQDMAPRTQLPYGEGIFRRRFLLDTVDEHHVSGAMEDDFHRFHLELRHDGERVVEMRGEAVRFPWTECPGANVPLKSLEGMALSAHANAGARHTDPRSNCTHLFDLACLAITHAARGSGRRLYDITVPDRIEGRTQATLHRDGELLLDWNLKGNAISAEPPFEGVRLAKSNFVGWVEEHLDPELGEAALALRRACFISMGRERNLDESPTAMDYMPLAKGSCHSFTPGIAEKTERMLGTTLEFTDDRDRMLSDVV